MNNISIDITMNTSNTNSTKNWDNYIGKARGSRISNTAQAIGRQNGLVGWALEQGSRGPSQLLGPGEVQGVPGQKLEQTGWPGWGMRKLLCQPVQNFILLYKNNPDGCNVWPSEDQLWKGNVWERDLHQDGQSVRNLWKSWIERRHNMGIILVRKKTAKSRKYLKADEPR